MASNYPDIPSSFEERKRRLAERNPSDVWNELDTGEFYFGAPDNGYTPAVHRRAVDVRRDIADYNAAEEARRREEQAASARQAGMAAQRFQNAWEKQDPLRAYEEKWGRVTDPEQRRKMEEGDMRATGHAAADLARRAAMRGDFGSNEKRTANAYRQAGYEAAEAQRVQNNRFEERRIGIDEAAKEAEADLARTKEYNRNREAMATIEAMKNRPTVIGGSSAILPDGTRTYTGKEGDYSVAPDGTMKASPFTAAPSPPPVHALGFSGGDARYKSVRNGI